VCVCVCVCVDRPGPVTSLLVTVLPRQTDEPGRRALVTWQAPADNSTLIGYIISYQVIGVGDCNSSLPHLTRTLPRLSADTTSHMLTGLTSWLHYRVIVQAINVARAGLESTADIIMPGAGTVYRRVPLVTSTAMLCVIATFSFDFLTSAEKLL